MTAGGPRATSCATALTFVITGGRALATEILLKKEPMRLFKVIAQRRAEAGLGCALPGEVWKPVCSFAPIWQLTAGRGAACRAKFAPPPSPARDRRLSPST